MQEDSQLFAILDCADPCRDIRGQRVGKLGKKSEDIILVVAASTVLAFVFLAIFRAWRRKRSPQMSL